MDSIKETYDYDMFNFKEFNRRIKKSALAKLDKSVKKEGWLKHPITVNEKYEVMDGQHRLLYAKQHKLPVYYIVIDGLEPKDCVVMNNARMSWSLEDFINLYVSQGNENYIRLQTLLDKYSFTSTGLMCSLAKGNLSAGSITKTIRNGEFRITEREMEKMEQKFNFLSDIAPFINKIPGRSTSLFIVTSFCYDHPQVDKRRLRKQIKEMIGTITPPASLDAALKEMETLYNYRAPKKDYVYIATDYKKAALENSMGNLKPLQGKQIVLR